MAASLEVSDLATGVRVLTLSNTAKRNALDKGVLEQLREALRVPPGIRALLLRGAGEGIFCAGYDLHELAAYREGEVLPDDHVADVLDGLTHHRLPSVALINGPAFGAGCELAMACDLRVGDPAARFCMPPVKLGLVYSRKGFERVASRVGVSAARFLFLTGRPVTADRALQLGLVDLLAIDAKSAAAEAHTLADELASASPAAIEGTKAGLALLGPSASPETLSRYQQLRAESFTSGETKARLSALIKRPGASTD